MAKRHHPRRGSMAFSPRKRAQRHFGRVKSWPQVDSKEIRVQGFAGWKAGMTHVMMRDMNPRSTSAGQEIRVPVTVVEVPEMIVLGVRGYKMTPYGKQTAGEAWLESGALVEAFPEIGRRLPEPKAHESEKHFEALMEEDLCEVRLIVATQPGKVSGSPSKTPEVMELGLCGGTPEEQRRHTLRSDCWPETLCQWWLQRGSESRLVPVDRHTEACEDGIDRADDRRLGRACEQESHGSPAVGS